MGCLLNFHVFDPGVKPELNIEFYLIPCFLIYIPVVDFFIRLSEKFGGKEGCF